MSTDRKQIDKVLTIIFYVLTLAALILYFVTPDRATDITWMYCGFGAIIVRIVSYLMRFLF